MPDSLRAFSVATILAVLVGGCGAGPAPRTEPKQLDPAQIRGGTYYLPYNRGAPIALVDGRRSGVPTENPAVTMDVTMEQAIAFGDLDGDGVDDAAAVLATSLGGTGTYRDLAAVLNDRGRPRHVSNAVLGDRVQVQALAIAAGVIRVDLLTHAATDPMCCPTQKTTRRFRFNGERLVEVQ